MATGVATRAPIPTTPGGNEGGLKGHREDNAGYEQAKMQAGIFAQAPELQPPSGRPLDRRISL